MVVEDALPYHQVGPKFVTVRFHRSDQFPGMIAWDAWELLKSKADDRLPPQMAEMVSDDSLSNQLPLTIGDPQAHKTNNPFVQCITDVISPKNLYMGDKVVFVGDALAGFRPHTVASTRSETPLLPNTAE